MFGLSLGEIIMTGTIALVLLGPEKMISLMISLGKLFGKLRKAVQEIKGEVDHAGVVKELEKIGNKTVLDTGSFTPGPSIFGTKTETQPKGSWTGLSSDTQRIIALEKEISELKDLLKNSSVNKKTERNKPKGVPYHGYRKKTRK